MLQTSQTKLRSRLMQKLEEDNIDLPALFEFYQSSKQPITNLRTLMSPIQDKVERLMERDYDCVIVDNADGTLCPSYPYRLCIPVGLKSCDHCSAQADHIPTVHQLQEYFSSSSLGRGRGRFVAPVSLVHYCDSDLHLARFSLRSASLVQRPEVLLNVVTRRRHRLTKSLDMTAVVTENVREKPHEGGSRRERIARKLHLSSAKIQPPKEEEKKKEDLRKSVPVPLIPAPQPLPEDGAGMRDSTSSLSEVEILETSEPMSFEAKEALADTEGVQTAPDKSSMSKIRKADAKSLRGLGVSYIGDLMVEEKLKLMYVLAAVSSEKADRHDRYGSTRLFSIPYPGYEYFAACTIKSKKLLSTDPEKNQKHHHQYLTQAHDSLSFAWESLCSAKLNVPKVLKQMPENSINPELLQIEWDQYKSWHIDNMTQNYVKLLVSCFSAKDCPVLDRPFEGGGVLVHCIMGWDRTPTIVALLRMSLWADGVVNPSLSAKELIYLSIAYDWISFGHDLVYRSRQGVELMYYCFTSLRLIQEAEYSFFHAMGKTELAQEKNAERRSRLQALMDTFMPVYAECFRLL